MDKPRTEQTPRKISAALKGKPQGPLSARRRRKLEKKRLYDGSGDVLPQVEPREAEILRRHYGQGATLREIAFDLGISEERVYALRERGLRRLRKLNCRLKLPAELDTPIEALGLSRRAQNYLKNVGVFTLRCIVELKYDGLLRELRRKKFSLVWRELSDLLPPETFAGLGAATDDEPRAEASQSS
jgi:hypothetical protein